jgi:hypothetical protein
VESYDLDALPPGLMITTETAEEAINGIQLGLALPSAHLGEGQSLVRNAYPGKITLSTEQVQESVAR